MSKVDVYDSDDKKLSDKDRIKICSECNFINPETSFKRRHNTLKPDGPTNREKCIKQKIQRDRKGNIIGLKSWWVKT